MSSAAARRLSLNACSRSMFWSEMTPVARLAGEQRDEHDRLRRLPDQRPSDCRPPRRAGNVLVDRRSARGSRARPSRNPITSIGSPSRRSPRSIAYGKRISPGVSSTRRDVHDLGVEDLPDPVADEVVHRLHARGSPASAPLDVVDQRELGVPLAGLLEQPRVLERDAEAAGERDEQPHVRFGERVLAVEVLQRDRRRSPVRPTISGTKTRRLRRLAR